MLVLSFFFEVTAQTSPKWPTSPSHHLPRGLLSPHPYKKRSSLPIGPAASIISNSIFILSYLPLPSTSCILASALVLAVLDSLSSGGQIAHPPLASGSARLTLIGLDLLGKKPTRQSDLDNVNIPITSPKTRLIGDLEGVVQIPICSSWVDLVFAGSADREARGEERRFEIGGGGRQGNTKVRRVLSRDARVRRGRRNQLHDST